MAALKVHTVQPACWASIPIRCGAGCGNSVSIGAGFAGRRCDLPLPPNDKNAQVQARIMGWCPLLFL